ncbi:MAG: hypothetical protein WC141_09090 [Arcobacteraceae bacterium]
MLKKIIISAFIIFLFSGCSVTWAEFQDGYKQAKVIYKDVKYVVYEVVEEKKQVEADLNAK